MSCHLCDAAVTLYMHSAFPNPSPWWYNLNIHSQGMFYIYHKDCGSFIVTRITQKIEVSKKGPLPSGASVVFQSSPLRCDTRPSAWCWQLSECADTS